MPTGVNRVPEPWEWVRTKKCTLCGEIKPWAKFSPAKHHEDGTVSRVNSRCIACHVQIAKRYKTAWRERNKEHARAYEREWRRRRRSQMQAEAATNSVRLPAEPFKRFLWQQVMGMENPSWLDLAAQCGVPERSIRRVLTQANVSLRFADEVCTRLGSSIYDLWPHLAEGQAA